MFDIGFSELLFLAVIAMLVIGPKRLPETLRFLGLWTGRIKRSLSRAYQELEREVGLDDIKRQLHNEEIMRSLEDSSRRREQQAKPPPAPAASESGAAASKPDSEEPADKDITPPHRQENDSDKP